MILDGLCGVENQADRPMSELQRLLTGEALALGLMVNAPWLNLHDNGVRCEQIIVTASGGWIVLRM